jgi:hypothetical protein
MGKVLTEDTVLKCAAGAAPAPHGGTLSKSGVARMKVDGTPVLTAAKILAATISACGNTNTNAGQVRCTGVSSVTAGKATRLTVDGNPVVIASVGGVTTGTPPGTIKASTGIHDRLQAE